MTARVSHDSGPAGRVRTFDSDGEARAGPVRGGPEHDASIMIGTGIFLMMHDDAASLAA